MKGALRTAVTLAVGGVVLACLPAAVSGQAAAKPVLTLKGFGLNLTGVGAGRSGELEITLERWSSDEERERLQKAMADSGVAGLTKSLLALSPRVGVVRTQRGGSLDLKFAREVALPDGGRRLVLATDRLEAPKANPGADKHEFLAVEIRLGKDGKGEGRTAGPERLRYSKEAGTLELDKYGTEPVWIKDLHVVTAKP